MRVWALLLAQALLLALPVSGLWPTDLVAAPVLTMVIAAAVIGAAVPALHVRVLASCTLFPRLRFYLALATMTQRTCIAGDDARHAQRARARAECR